MSTNHRLFTAFSQRIRSITSGILPLNPTLSFIGLIGLIGLSGLFRLFGLLDSLGYDIHL